MYKDKEKQKEANRQAQIRFKAKGITEGITGQGITDTKRVIPTGDKRGKDIKCFEDLHPGIQATIDELSMDIDPAVQAQNKATRTANAIHYQHMFPNRYEPQGAVCTGVVTGKPGDADYDGVCTSEWIAEHSGANRP